MSRYGIYLFRTIGIALGFGLLMTGILRPPAWADSSKLYTEETTFCKDYSDEIHYVAKIAAAKLTDASLNPISIDALNVTSSFYTGKSVNLFSRSPDGYYGTTITWKQGGHPLTLTVDKSVFSTDTMHLQGGELLSVITKKNSVNSTYQDVTIDYAAPTEPRNLLTLSVLDAAMNGKIDLVEVNCKEEMESITTGSCENSYTYPRCNHYTCTESAGAKREVSGEGPNCPDGPEVWKTFDSCGVVSNTIPDPLSQLTVKVNDPYAAVPAPTDPYAK